jgi:hypothetical protein
MCGGGSPSDCQGGGDRFLLAPGSPCGHGDLALELADGADRLAQTAEFFRGGMGWLIATCGLRSLGNAATPKAFIE